MGRRPGRVGVYPHERRRILVLYNSATHTMIKSVDELKELLIWAKAQGIQSLQVGEIKADFSILAMSEAYHQESIDSQKPTKELSNLSTELMVDTEEMTKEEEDELLFHSARP